MIQSVGLPPKAAEISAGSWGFNIIHHRVEDAGMFTGLLTLIKLNNPADWNRVVLQMEQKGITFEDASRYCCHELSREINKRVHLFTHYYDFKNQKILLAFAKSVAGRRIAEKLVEQIKSCTNWDEFYREMNPECDSWGDTTQQIETWWHEWQISANIQNNP